MPRNEPNCTSITMSRKMRNSDHRDVRACGNWNMGVLLAAVATGLLGVLVVVALRGSSARPSVDPTPDSLVAHEAQLKEQLAASVSKLKDLSGVPGILKLRGGHLPEEIELPPDMADFENETMLEPAKMPELGEMPSMLDDMDFPDDLPEMSALEFPEMSEAVDTPSILAVTRDANSKVQGLVDQVKGEARETMSSIGWSVGPAPFKALTYCSEGVRGLVSIVKVDVGEGHIAQLTIAPHGEANSTAMLLSVEAVLAGDKSCMGKPVVMNATKEVQKIADDVKNQVPAILKDLGWLNFDIEPFKAISFCSQGTHLIVRLGMGKFKDRKDVDLQLWLHRQPKSLYDGATTLVSGAAIVKSSDKRCSAEPVEPAMMATV